MAKQGNISLPESVLLSQQNIKSEKNYPLGNDKIIVVPTTPIDNKQITPNSNTLKINNILQSTNNHNKQNAKKNPLKINNGINEKLSQNLSNQGKQAFLSEVTGKNIILKIYNQSMIN